MLSNCIRKNEQNEQTKEKHIRNKWLRTTLFLREHYKFNEIILVKIKRITFENDCKIQSDSFICIGKYISLKFNNI